jgi:hypothetical protein
MHISRFPEMITIFAMPKAFRGHIDVIQRNAIKSWTRLSIKPEIILLGTDEGTAEVAREFGLRHIPEVARNAEGTPLVNDLFAQAQRYAANNFLCYVNADIILLDDFSAAVEKITRLHSPLLMVGQRTDLDITQPIDFSNSDWERRLREEARASGVPRPYTFIDYFAFSKGLYADLLPLALGRGGWDNWLIWRARSCKATVIDVSSAVLAVHQNHDYSHHPDGSKGVWNGPEAQRNRELIGLWYHKHTIEDASHHLTPHGLKRSRRHAWLVVKRAWSHPRGVVLLTLEMLSRPFRRASRTSPS